MQSVANEPIIYDPADPEHRVRPWPMYRRLLEEAPVHRMAATTVDGEDFYILSRYDDVAMALRDRRQFSSHVRRGDFLDLPIMVNRDAPDHTRLRRVTNRALGPRALSSLNGWIQQTVEELVEDLLAQRSVEFVDQFSTALPLRVVGGMLGFPMERKAEMQRWSQAVIEVFSVMGGLDPELVPGFFEDFMGLVGYIDELAAERVGCPHRGDILSDLVCRRESGDVDHDEMVGLGWSYVAAGMETTMNLLGGGMRMLLEDRHLGRVLTADPDRTDDFIDEYLRLYTPTPWLLRRAEVDVVLHDTVIPRGALVHTLLAAANRDPRKFPDPDAFDLDRPNKEDHMAFGAGPHFCPGAVLGKLFAGKAFRAIYPHLDRMSIDPERPPRLRSRPGTYGIEYMGLLIEPETRADAS
ncbi:cytochrome P450 [Plantactinospora sp. KLBMP9567]|uniref:cytochrome P450 n=1 Tax=Plantactinospora sp. KLBMP9567 TaxID=3085900 RepID=UPI0029816A61|nr:cytochrome P450 [Plantactinospora sp. KLBMP9567]MDW5328805.1 cytochrome P450 [Plantactinospora sp. KLBMP9567]